MEVAALLELLYSARDRSRTVSATVHRRHDPARELDLLKVLSDQLALAVEEDRGVLLRTAVLVDGEELSSSEVVEIAFDEPIRPDLFRPLR